MVVNSTITIQLWSAPSLSSITVTSEPLLNSSIVIVMQLIPPTLYSESLQLDVHSCVALNATVETLNLSDTHQNLFGNISLISPSFTFSDPDLV